MSLNSRGRDRITHVLSFKGRPSLLLTFDWPKSYGHVSGSQPEQLYPSEYIWQCLKTFFIFTAGMGKWEAEHYWHLVGKGQGCCQTSYNTQESPSQQKFIQPKMSIVPRLKNPGPCLISSLERK